MFLCYIMSEPTRLAHPTSNHMRVRRKEEKRTTPGNPTRAVAPGSPRRGHTRNGAARRSQGEKILQAEVADLEMARAKLARQNEELVAHRATLEYERGRYQELFNFAPDGYVVTNLHGRIEDANVAACRLLNREQHALSGHRFAEFFAPEDRQKLLELPLAKPDPSEKAERVEAYCCPPMAASRFLAHCA